ncbi:MAG: NTP transferase domain-containing protein [Planctomycetes bacterium]|nr:NTP transferase domain-containing protein [Planctomycetota bacterium]
MTTVAIVLAAGRGQRMGADKALLDLNGRTAFDHVAAQCHSAGVDLLLVVRRDDAAELPQPQASPPVQVVRWSGDGDMADSLRIAESRLPAATTTVVVLPIDHALVTADTLVAVAAAAQRPGAAIALPLYRGKPGHPVALTRAVFAEIRTSGRTLRDLVRTDQGRVTAVPTANPWVLADLDHQDDLRDARAALAAGPACPVAQMFAHRSRRAYSSTPLAPGQLERLVDAARHASTSSWIQAATAIAVHDQAHREHIAVLCGNQDHIRQAPVFLAICADLHRLGIACQRVGDDVQTASLELFLQAVIDASLFAQNLALAAESEGLGICMIGGARNHPVELATRLGLPPRVFVVFGMTIGHATDEPIPRGRMPLAGILHRDHYDTTGVDAALDGADAAMRRWAGRTNTERGGYQGRLVDESRGFRERVAQSTGSRSRYLQSRLALREELRRLGFDLG